MFKVGDLVSWCGVNGKVIDKFKNMKHPDAACLIVEFDHEYVDFYGSKSKMRQNFLRDGRLHPWHKEVSLKLR